MWCCNPPNTFFTPEHIFAEIGEGDKTLEGKIFMKHNWNVILFCVYITAAMLWCWDLWEICQCSAIPNQEINLILFSDCSLFSTDTALLVVDEGENRKHWCAMEEEQFSPGNDTMFSIYKAELQHQHHFPIIFAPPPFICFSQRQSKKYARKMKWLCCSLGKLTISIYVQGKA